MVGLMNNILPMKSLIKIISLVSLIILPVSPGISSKNVSKLFALQDTMNLKHAIKVDSFPLPIVPPSSGVQFYKDNILFLSLTKNERKMSPNHISFGTVEAYYAAFMDSVEGKHNVFSQFFPFPYPSEAVTFSNSYDTIYFTKLADNDKEKIFMAKYAPAGMSQTGITGGITSMDFCTGNYNYSHPSLSADGKSMIFASDREGSLGGMDLFISRRTGKTWSAPENLGNVINTSGNEFFPFLDQDNNLYFSSDGLKGSGGYDIFTCKFNGKGWNKPANLSDRINSRYDDIAFTINKSDKKSAFFTRKAGNGEMQLFRVKVSQANSNLMAVFNGNPAPKTMTATVSNEDKKNPDEVLPAEKTKPAVVEPIKKKTETAAEKKPENKPSAVNTNVRNNQPKTNAATEAPAQTGAKSVIIKPTLPLPADQKDVVIYRIQVLASNKPRSEKEISLSGKNYKLYEYFYLGAYRYSIGEFTTLQPAIELQKVCRSTGYPDAFVAAFKNNTRSIDLKSFK